MYLSFAVAIRYQFLWCVFINIVVFVIVIVVVVVVIIIVIVLAFVITTIIFALVFFVKGSLLTDIFTGVALEIVTATFAIGYLSEPGVGMALGRRWCTHSLFGAGMPIIVKAPHLCLTVVDLAGSEGNIGRRCLKH